MYIIYYTTLHLASNCNESYYVYRRQKKMFSQNQTVRIRMNKMYVYINILCIVEYNKKNNNYVMYTMVTRNLSVQLLFAFETR